MSLELREPKEITIPDQNGNDRAYTISKFPAIAGREIVTQYPLTALPKVGEYSTNEALMLKLLGYVAVKTSKGTSERLRTRELIDNHVPDYETLMRLEGEMMAYNCSFFLNGRASTFLGALAQKVPPLITKILMALSEQSPPAEKPPIES